jgi:hypothetical protein
VQSNSDQIPLSVASMPGAAAPRKSGLNALPYVVIRIIGGDARDTSRIHAGTGFFYILNGNIPLIVSNKHVLCEKSWLEFDFGEGSPEGGRVLAPSTKLRLNQGQLPIFQHQDPNVDLAAIPLAPLLDTLSQSGKQPHALFLSQQNLAPAEIENFLLPATSVLMVGFPNGLMDEANNLPVVRRGSLATPYKADYQGKTDFVVDIAAFGGSSGSPVFAFFEHFVPGEGTIGIVTEPQFFLLGVLYSGPVMTAEGEIVHVPVPTDHYIAKTQLMIHLGNCVKAARIEELFAVIKPHLDQTPPSS